MSLQDHLKSLTLRDQNHLALLKLALEVAVPMWILELRGLPTTERQRLQEECAQYIAEHGDVILYREKGKTAPAFNKLACGIAILAFSSGGVDIFGLHFEGAS